jgi:hypothetical protein
MAGNKRFATIVFLGLSVLAATGAGAYYLLVSSGWTLALTHQQAAAQPQPAAAAPADLDAVASAWAEPVAEPSSDTANYSATSRSADVALARAEEEVIYHPRGGEHYSFAQCKHPRRPRTRY